MAVSRRRLSMKKVRRILTTAARFGWLDREQTDLALSKYNEEITSSLSMSRGKASSFSRTKVHFFPWKGRRSRAFWSSCRTPGLRNRSPEASGKANSVFSGQYSGRHRPLHGNAGSGLLRARPPQDDRSRQLHGIFYGRRKTGSAASHWKPSQTETSPALPLPSKKSTVLISREGHGRTSTTWMKPGICFKAGKALSSRRWTGSFVAPETSSYEVAAEYSGGGRRLSPFRGWTNRSSMNGNSLRLCRITRL